MVWRINSINWLLALRRELVVCKKSYCWCYRRGKNSKKKFLFFARHALQHQSRWQHMKYSHRTTSRHANKKVNSLAYNREVALSMINVDLIHDALRHVGNNPLYWPITEPCTEWGGWSAKYRWNVQMVRQAGNITPLFLLVCALNKRVRDHEYCLGYAFFVVKTEYISNYPPPPPQYSYVTILFSIYWEIMLTTWKSKMAATFQDGRKFSQ